MFISQPNKQNQSKLLIQLRNVKQERVMQQMLLKELRSTFDSINQKYDLKFDNQAVIQLILKGLDRFMLQFETAFKTMFTSLQRRITSLSSKIHQVIKPRPLEIRLVHQLNQAFQTASKSILRLQTQNAHLSEQLHTAQINCHHKQLAFRKISREKSSSRQHFSQKSTGSQSGKGQSVLTDCLQHSTSSSNVHLNSRISIK